MVVDGQGQWWLAFGSFWSGIKLIKLNASTGKRAGTTVRSLARRTGSTTAIEAPFIAQHGGYYHYYADSGASYLGINLVGYDSAGWPYVR